MNIVLIVSDTLRWDHLGASGNSWIRTPNLDRLAAQSVVFAPHRHGHRQVGVPPYAAARRSAPPRRRSATRAPCTPAR